MELYKMTLELADPTSMGLRVFLKRLGYSFSIHKTPETTRNGYNLYILISTKDNLIEFLEGFYDEGEEFFNQVSELI